MSFLPPSITPKEYYNRLYSASFKEKIKQLPKSASLFSEPRNPTPADTLFVSQHNLKLEEHRVALINLMDRVGEQLEGEEKNIFLQKACEYIENHFEEVIQNFVKYQQKQIWKMLENRYGSSTYSPIFEVRKENIHTFLSEHPFVLLGFWAPWYSPYKILSPAIEKLVDMYQDKVAIGKVNVEQQPAIAQEYQVVSIPSLLFFKQGKLQQRITGNHSPEALCQLINNILK